MRIRFIIKCFIVQLFAILLSIQVLALDYPHSSVNNISCDSCHYVYGGTPSLLPPWMVHVPQDIDDTQFNTLCWSCHNDIEAPYVRTHSSLQTDNYYGYWTIECRTCHNPHEQPQIRAHGSDSFLYSGISTAVTSTTLTLTGAGWSDDEYQGLVLIPNVDRTSRLKYGYKITANTIDTLTVEGPIDLSRVGVGDTFAIIYGKLVQSTIVLDEIIAPSVPKEGDRTVRFFRTSGTNSFADGDATYDGVCEVCHTETTYHRNDGTGTSHNEALNCIQCHNHVYGFAHGQGGVVSADCEECHGHDAGYEYYPGEYSLGAGSYVSHSTHTENDADDLRGPAVVCVDCHETGGFPYFRSGIDSNGDGYITLSETDVCDTCHSPGGTYDGVNDSVIGAKNNWSGIGSSISPVYEAGGSLKSGREKWCAGCHDEAPSEIQSVNAPNVIGDEDMVTGYGIGYGYYKTGHGLPGGSYPASGAPAANLGCIECHDTTVAHIDGIARTYKMWNDNYQAGYRLKDVNGGSPMDIPRGGPLSLLDFPLCFSCHESDPIMNSANLTSNFINPENDPPNQNLHWFHLQTADGFFKNKWDSDWNGVPGDGDTAMSCPLCHNVHGSPSPRMMRHGELIEGDGTIYQVPEIDFQYLDENGIPDGSTTLSESTGGRIDSYFGSVSVNCRVCHHGAIVTYTRTPNP